MSDNWLWSCPTIVSQSYCCVKENDNASENTNVVTIYKRSFPCRQYHFTHILLKLSHCKFNYNELMTYIHLTKFSSMNSFYLIFFCLIVLHISTHGCNPTAKEGKEYWFRSTEVTAIFFIFPYICSFLLHCHIISKREIRCHWVQEDHVSRLYTSLVLSISYGTAKTKLAILASLYSVSLWKTLISNSRTEISFT